MAEYPESGTFYTRVEEPESQELLPEEDKHPALENQNRYPLEKLNDRLFERLTTRLFQAEIRAGEHGDRFELAELMQGVAEQGRDVVLRNGGVMAGAVQCKHSIDPTFKLSRPGVAKELLKLLLHSIQDAHIFPDPPGRFLWFIATNGGLSQPARDFVGSPVNYLRDNLDDLKSWTEAVISQYDRIKLDYGDELRDKLLERLGRVDAAPRTGDTISDAIENHRESVAPAFFRLKTVVVGQQALLSNESLTARFRKVLHGEFPTQLWDCVQHNLIPRPSLDRAVAARLAGARFGWTVVLGRMGAGKTVWAFSLALKVAEMSPTILLRAKDLHWNSDDPISAMLSQVAHGAASGERIIQLGQFIAQRSLSINVVLDGVDEIPDYLALERALRSFRRSALAPRTHIVMVIREGAWPRVKPLLASVWPDLNKTRCAGVRRLARLEEREAKAWLGREGATTAEVRKLMGHLPSEFQGRPLFLSKGLELLRGGALMQDAPFSYALSEDFVETLVSSRRGTGPVLSSARVRRCLGQLAWACLASPREAVSRDELEVADPAWEDDGEHGLLERCHRAGLLTPLGEGSVCFAHSFYQAAFAADAMRSATAEDWTRKLELIPISSLRARLLSIVSYLPTIDSLFQILLQRDVTLALLCASQAPKALSSIRETAVLEYLSALWDTKFPSDERAGLKLLASMRGPKARELAVERFNNSAPAEKEFWSMEWAEVFLQLEIVEAADVILRHRQLRSGADFTWIEPAFVEELAKLSPSFRAQLADSAYERVIKTKGGYAPAEMLLACLRDERLVEICVDRLSGGPLGAREHRLLIFLDTPDALWVYVDSAQIWIERMVALRGQNQDDGGQAFHNLMAAVVPMTTDIRMYPHDQLIEVVEACLSSSLREMLYVGNRWAEFLGHTSLLLPWASAQPTRWLTPSRGVEEAVRRGGVQVASPHMNDDAPPVLRRALAWSLHACPGRDTEELLLRALEWEDCRSATFTSLGYLRVVRAVPRLCALLPETSGYLLFSLIHVLGEIGHDSAVGPMIEWLHGLPVDEWQAHAQTVSVSLAAIGGEKATSELVALVPRLSEEGHVLAALLARADPSGLELAYQRLLVRTELRAKAIDVLGGLDLNRYLLQSISGPWTHLEPHIQHPQLSVLLLMTLDESLDHHGRWSHINNPLRAAGRLDSPDTRAWLESIARLKSVWDTEDKQRSVDASTCARQVLAELGVKPFVSEAVDRQIDENIGREFGWFSTHYLDLWPRSVVRARLLHRIGLGERSKPLAWLLTRYAEPQDAPLLHELETSDDLSIADIVHQMIRWEGFASER